MAQTFYYNGDTYMYRVSEAGLKRYIKETGNSILQELSKRPENIVRILYYTVCWGAVSVSVDQFVNDYRRGWLRFRPGLGEHSILGIRRIIRNAVRTYQLEFW